MSANMNPLETAAKHQTAWTISNHQSYSLLPPTSQEQGYHLMIFATSTWSCSFCYFGIGYDDQSIYRSIN
jgi:hypothetical protein